MDIDNSHIACQPLSMWDHTGCSSSYAAMIGLPAFHIAIGIEATAAIYNRKKLWTPITVLKGYLDYLEKNSPQDKLTEDMLLGTVSSRQGAVTAYRLQESLHSESAWENLMNGAICTLFGAGIAAVLAKKWGEGRMSAILAIEDGRAVNRNLENLKQFYDMGVRALSLT